MSGQIDHAVRIGQRKKGTIISSQVWVPPKTSTAVRIRALIVTAPADGTIVERLGDSDLTASIRVSLPLLDRRILWMSIVGAALLLVTFTMTRLLAQKADIDKIVQNTYDSVRDSILLQLYGEALKACDDANKQILPKLDDQVKAAGKLAVETTEQLATNKQVAISQISNEAVRPLYSAVEETDISVRDVFFQVIRDATDESIARVERHTSRFGRIAKDIGRIKGELTDSAAE